VTTGETHQAIEATFRIERARLIAGRPEDYQEQIDLIARIPHLAPPEGAFPIRIDRFSPYFESLGAFGWSGLRPTLAWLAYHCEGRQVINLAVRLPQGFAATAESPGIN
jgi:hypothetical protein